MELAERDCERIEAGTPPISETRAAELADQAPDWAVGRDVIERAVKSAGFDEAIRFANAVPRLAAEQDHHPRICVDYDTVELSLTTHKIGGLSMNDFIMAAKINRLPA